MRPKNAARALLCASLIALSLAPIAGCMSKARQHLYTAEDLFEKRDLKGAQGELQQAIALDPDLLDAHKSLAHIDEYLGDTDGAGKEYDAASRLDPTDQKLLSKARYYRQLKQLESSAGSALDDIKAGKADDGVKTLKEILQSGGKGPRQSALDSLSKAGPIIQQQGDQLAQQQKYQDAINAYAQGIRVYLLIAEANNKTTLDPPADKLMESLTDSAKKAGTPERSEAILNEVLGVDSENKTANMQLAQLMLSHKPPDYDTAADLMERAGASDADVKQLRAKAKHH